MNRLMISVFLTALPAGFAATGCRSVQLAPQVRGASASYAADHESARRESDFPASAESTESAAVDVRWPARWGGDTEQRGTIIELDPGEPLRPIHLSRTHQFRSTPIEYSDANQLAADIGITRGFKFKAEGPGSFLFIPNPDNTATPDITKDSGKQDAGDVPDLAFKFVSATPIPPAPPTPEADAHNEPAKKFKAKIKNKETGEDEVFELTLGEPIEDPGEASRKDSTASSRRMVNPDEDYVELQRTWFTYRDPVLKGDSEAKGTIVLLPGMFGTPDVIIDGLEKFWYKNGFAVLRMRSHPSRYTEHRLFKVKPGHEADDAKITAALSDERVAEGAYATKAAVEYVTSKRPEMDGKPVVLVGMSGGAMMLPTVYAYAPEAYAGSVLIAGGADFMKIAIESNYKHWIDALVFEFWNEQSPGSNTFGNVFEPADGQLEALSDAYLRASKLDAYHTAQEMHDVPVLILHASTDEAVPAETGDLLYQQLGQPERWTYPIGHELIFAGLPTQATRINRWIKEHVLENAED